MILRSFFILAGIAWLLGSCASAPQWPGPSPSSNHGPKDYSGPPQRGEQGDPSKASTENRLAQSTLQSDRSTWPAPVHDDQSFTFLRAEQLEYRASSGSPDLFVWDAQGWQGSDYERLWVKTEGEQTAAGDSAGAMELQALYSRLIAPFWDFQIGARYDQEWGPGPDQGRWFGVVGLQGLSPYEFEVDSALFISEDADVSARLTATTDFLITQRLILQPRFETEIAFQEVPAFQVGQGFNYVELGLRLRYEIKREFAPYLGINWFSNLQKTEDIVRQAGGDANSFALLFGVTLWF